MVNKRCTEERLSLVFGMIQSLVPALGNFFNTIHADVGSRKMNTAPATLFGEPTPKDLAYSPQFIEFPASLASPSVGGLASNVWLVGQNDIACLIFRFTLLLR
jgi:hypothetical protein